MPGLSGGFQLVKKEPRFCRYLEASHGDLNVLSGLTATGTDS